MGERLTSLKFFFTKTISGILSVSEDSTHFQDNIIDEYDVADQSIRIYELGLSDKKLASDEIFLNKMQLMCFCLKIGTREMLVKGLNIAGEYKNGELALGENFQALRKGVAKIDAMLLKEASLTQLRVIYSYLRDFIGKSNLTTAERARNYDDFIEGFYGLRKANSNPGPIPDEYANVVNDKLLLERATRFKLINNAFSATAKVVSNARMFLF